jgi:hypothetical protein
MYDGQHAGIPVTRDQALRWITANRVGARDDSIVGTPRRMAEWWCRTSLLYTEALQVYNDGWLV